MQAKLSLLLASCFLLAACQQNAVRQQIVGEWRYDIDSMRRELVLTQNDRAQRSYMESMIYGLQMAKVSFKPDGSAVFNLDGTEKTGDWALRRNGRQLVMRLSDQPQVSQIEYISADTLVLYPASKREPQFKRILVAMNVPGSN
jgi:hypothetical protein